MKKIIALAVCILIAAFFNKTAAQNSRLLTITMYESTDKGYNKIIVIENDTKIEELELQSFYYKNLDSHLIEINKIIMKYRNQGYKIISEIRGTVGGTAAIVPVMVTTYRLEK
jgi:hypothetical protein